MANDVTTKILDIQVRYKDALDQIAKYRKAVEDTRKQQKELKKQLDEGKISQDEYGRQMEATRSFISAQNAAIGVLNRQVQNQMKAEQEQLGSLMQWRAELSNLTAEYDRLSQAEREGAKGTELKDKINEITSKLKEAEFATQRYYRNVGNYPQAMGGATVSADQLNEALSTQAKTCSEAVRQNEILQSALAGIDPNAAGASEAIDELNKKIKENNEIIDEHDRKSESLIDSLGGLLGVNTRLGSSFESLASNSSASFMEGLNVKAKALWQTLTGLLANPYILVFLGLAGAVSAVKWWYEYNKGLVEASRLTTEFTGLHGDEMKAYRNEVQAIADTYGKGFNEVLQSANVLSKQMGISCTSALSLIKDGFIAGADANGKYLDVVSEFPVYFKEAGISAEGFIAIATQASTMGVVSNKALDSIKEANNRLREMSEGTSQSLKDLGLNTTKIQQELTDGTKTTFEVMKEVSGKLAELPASSKTAAEAVANIFGGAGQDAGYQYLTTLKDIETNMDAVKKKGGEIAKLQEEQLNAQIELENTLASLFDTTGGWFETVTTQAKIFVTKGLTNIIKGTIDVVNYFIDLYNETFLVRTVVQSLVTVFKNAWTAAKTMLNSMITGFKGLGGVVKAVFSFDIKHPIDSVNRVKEAYTEGINAIADEWKDFGTEVVSNIGNGIDNIINGKARHIEYKVSYDTSEAETQVPDSDSKKKKVKSVQKKSASTAGKTPEEQELELMRKAEDEMLKLINDTYETRRQQIISAYDREIGDLKIQLLTKKNLTIEETERINAQILEMEQKKNADVLELERSVLNGTTSAYEAKRMQTQTQYDRQIEDYKKKLNTDNTLTEKSREAINSIITSLEAQKQKALDKLFQEELGKQIDHRQRMIELELAAVKAGSEQEFQLKMQQLQAQREAELNNTELTQKMRLAIEAKYRKMSEDLQNQHEQEVWEKQQEKMRTRFESENTMLNAQNEQKLANLEIMGASESQIELQNLWNQHAEQTSALAQMQEELANMRQQDGESRTEFEQRQAAKRTEISTQETKIKQTQASVEKTAYSSITSAIDAMGEHSKAFAVASKVLALGEIAINTGKAIAAGISQAQSVPFPANIAAIATTVATIVANVATAISTVKSAKFAEGGKVIGAGTGTSDSIPAYLSNGEFIMTARSTKMFEPLLMAMNNIGRGVPVLTSHTYQAADTAEQLSTSFKDAVQEFRPVVSVVEITEAQDRVNMIENLDNF